MKLNAAGDLIVTARNGAIAFHKPVVYQATQQVSGRFTLLADNTVSFAIGSYDHSRQLVIDPVLIYSTYLGGEVNDYATAITVDSTGATFVTGYTYSDTFPVTSGAYQPTPNNDTSRSNAFITKLNPTGTALVYSTYLGGSNDPCSANANSLTQYNYASAIALDSRGNAYVTGQTCSTDFPVSTTAFQKQFKGTQNHKSNAFVSAINSTGTKLVYSTYLGGSGSYYSGDFGNAIKVDSTGSAYVTGQTTSTDFPVTAGAFQTVNHSSTLGSTAFVTKLNPTGSDLVYSTYLGGSGVGKDFTSGESGLGIALNKGGNAYVTGYTYSADFPLSSGAFLTTNKAFAIGGSSPFVTELDTTGASLVYSTYIGGSGKAGNLEDSANAIAIDAAENIYIAGKTASSDFPVIPGNYQTTKLAKGNLTNGFITKLNQIGSDLLYSTYLGGSGNAKGTIGDSIEAIAIDSLNNLYNTGSTASTNFPITSGAFEKTNGPLSNSQVAFLTQLSPIGKGILYSTFFGGSGGAGNVAGDAGHGIAFRNGNAYLAGSAESVNFPVSDDAFQKTNNATAGSPTAFVSRFAFTTATVTLLISTVNPQKLGTAVTFTARVLSSTVSGTATGKVAFTLDGGAPVRVDLDSLGYANFTVAALTNELLW